MGILNKLGEYILDILINLIRSFVVPNLSVIGNFILVIINFKVTFNLIGLIFFITLLFPIYRLFDKKILSKTINEIVFLENFKPYNNGWNLNYWGSTNPSKTNKIENGEMIFEADNNEWINNNNENGAYFDLRNGIYEGNKYLVSCKLKSTKNTTMGFRLWLHDIEGNSSVVYPKDFFTPDEKNETVELEFTATKTNGIRIHLHNKAGLGKIIIKEVKVIKI
jgi:predicted membrane protein